MKINNFKELNNKCQNDIFALVVEIDSKSKEIHLSDINNNQIKVFTDKKINSNVISTIQKIRLAMVNKQWQLIAIRELNVEEEKNIDKNKYLNKQNDKQNNKLTKIADLEEKKESVLFVKLIEDMREEKTSNGKIYLLANATDGENNISLKKWNSTFKDVENIDVSTGKLIKVQGKLDIWEQTSNFIIDKIRNVFPSDNIDESLFIKQAPHTGEFMFSFIEKIVKGFKDEDYKKIVEEILKKYKKQLFYFPAGQKVHHDEKCGLLYHIYNMLKSCIALSNIYAGIVPDILYTGVILHDIGKIKELDSNQNGVVNKYSTDGELLGHIGLGIEIVSIIGTQLNIPKEKILIINHMIASHQSPELGGLINPKFLEAEILKNIDMIDSRIYMFNKAYKDVNKGEFSDKQFFLNKVKVYNHEGEKTIEKE